MKWTRKNIDELDKIYRLNLINSVTGIKSANLIGTRSPEGESNLAIFSSVVHLGSNPPLIGCIIRPHATVRRHTYENLNATGYYTINHVHESFIENAHYTSAKFEKEVSEFEMCRLTEEYIDEFSVPFVQESHLKMGMKLIQRIPIPINKTELIIGSIELLVIEGQEVGADGQLDLALLNSIGVSGLNTYYTLKREARFPYARVSEVPKFQ